MDLINQLAMVYMGQSKYYGGVAPADLEAQEERVVYKILLQRVCAFG